MTITIAYVIYKSSMNFKINKNNIIKELGSYLLAIVVILYQIYFNEGFDYNFIYQLLILYIFYVFYTFYFKESSSTKLNSLTDS